MSDQANTILNAALQLSDLERMAIVSKLLETLPENETGFSLDDPNLEQELDQRFANLEGAVSWQSLRDSTQ